MSVSAAGPAKCAGLQAASGEAKEVSVAVL